MGAAVAGLGRRGCGIRGQGVAARAARHESDGSRYRRRAQSRHLRARHEPRGPGAHPAASRARAGLARAAARESRECTMTERLVTAAKRETDAFEATIRPQSLDEFIGQEQARANLKVFVQAATARGDALDHVLFAGPPGLGKTTLAQIMAKELGVGFRATSGPVISKAGDLAALLTNLEDRDVLFIDEIHRLNPAVEEILYPAMEDFQLDLIIGEGPAARSVKIELSRFT